MRKAVAAFMALTLFLCLAGCGARDTESGGLKEETKTAPAEKAAGDESVEDEDMKPKALVAYFSRAGENYGVGYIEYGSTRIIADMIAESVGAELFEIARVEPYPDGYSDCTDEAAKERNADARPALTSTVDNFDDYDIIYLGYPIWWGDMPMPVYTFLESYDFTGKTVVPFCTHAGSGLSGTVRTLSDKLTGASVLEGLAIAGTTAQNDRDDAQTAVDDWLSKLKIGE